MKKSQLRKIIRESLKELKGKKQPLNEMKCGCDVPNNPQAYTIKQCASCDENCCTGAFELSKQDNIMAPTLSPGKKLINKKSITEQNPNQEACQSAGTTYNQQASSQVGQAYNAGFPFSGRPGISPQFVDNMAGKPTQFYLARHNAFSQKKQSLSQASGHPYCNGDNPMWQAKLSIKSMYVKHCKNNPGIC